MSLKIMELMYFMFEFCEVKIGRPGYRVTKQFDPETKQRSLLFQVRINSSYIPDIAKIKHARI